MRFFALAGQAERDERGFTLVELMVAIVLSTFVMLGGGEMLRQMIVASSHNADGTIAVIQVQNAGFWVSQDAVQAQTVPLCFDPATDPQKRLLTLGWTDWDSTVHSITYSMVDTTDELGRSMWDFMRYDNITDETIRIAELLDPAGTSCTWNAVDGLLELTVTAKVDNETETRTFEIQPRSF